MCDCIICREHHNAVVYCTLLPVCHRRPSAQVDESFASVIKAEVSDGIIAPSYTPGALEVLRAKKGGKFIVLAAVADAVVFSINDSSITHVPHH